MSGDKQYTIADVQGQKKKVIEEIRKSRNEMRDRVHDIFEPPKAATKFEAIMNNVDRAVAVYDGVMLGMRTMHMVRRFFSRKKR